MYILLIQLQLLCFFLVFFFLVLAGNSPVGIEPMSLSYQINLYIGSLCVKMYETDVSKSSLPPFWALSPRFKFDN